MKRLLTTLAVFSIVVFSCKKKDIAPPPTVPLVSTAALTNITTSGATAGGSIVSDNGAAVTKSGIVWSKSNNLPTLADTVINSTATTGAFTVNITGLDFNTVYYIRAFATNSIGTGYGAVVTLNTANDTSKVRFTYNGQEVVYGIIISPTTGKKWLDRNLGAMRVATAYDDYQAYGDFFQWGRPADGHQLMNWTAPNAGTPVNGTTTTLATSDNPGHSNFIIGPDPYYDWRSDQNRNRWATTPQGPCPTGWHVPTKVEWAAEVKFEPPAGWGTATTGGMTDRNTAYSIIKLTAAGTRKGWVASGYIAVGNHGYYWSSTDEFVPANGYVGALGTEIQAPNPQGYALGLINSVKSQSMPVRCVKD